MTNFGFLQKYFHLQDGVSFDKLINLGFALIGYCQTEPSTLSNNCLVNTVLTPDEISQISKHLQDLNRTPAIYFERRPDLEPLEKLLIENGFKKEFEDSWMFYETPVQNDE